MQCSPPKNLEVVFTHLQNLVLVGDTSLGQANIFTNNWQCFSVMAVLENVGEHSKFRSPSFL
jgi:hypothetical protein